MTNVVLAIVLLLILGSALFYVVKAKKSGVKCIGCPHAKACGQGECTCSISEQEN
ncbi:MAG: FeoB-associated Cys-rich membrane protein [Clostridia bacterium]|nr:FeoB-associated Cys-rich membrane protein [Clostridia bacterium]